MVTDNIFLSPLYTPQVKNQRVAARRAILKLRSAGGKNSKEKKRQRGLIDESLHFFARTSFD
jgi:hypothetical protein